MARFYSDALAGSSLTLPHIPNWAEPAWHLYVVRSKDREALQSRFADASIGTLVHYPIPPHMQKAYASAAIAEDALPIARDLAGEVLSLPIGPEMSLEVAALVVKAALG